MNDGLADGYREKLIPDRASSISKPTPSYRGLSSDTTLTEKDASY